MYKMIWNLLQLIVFHISISYTISIQLRLRKSPAKLFSAKQRIK